MCALYRPIVTALTASGMLFVVASVARASEQDARRQQRALHHAVRLASPGPGVRVLLVDPELAPDPKLLEPLDAFVVRERDGALRPIIYVNRRSEIVRRAAEGSDFHVHVLAAVIHHEAQHLAGASEAEARRAELAFFKALVGRGQVPASVGLSYLQLLARNAASTSPPQK